MIVVFKRKEKQFLLRPRCKDCHNKRERKNRREYKREYLRKWRSENSELNRSYWKDNPVYREKFRVNAYKRFIKNHETILIQGRFARRGRSITLYQAKELLKIFGRCYPTRQGLTSLGLKECERIRSRFRIKGEKPPSNFDIRLEVYENDRGHYEYVIRPEDQPEPYKTASETLRRWHRDRRAEKEAAGNDHAN